MESIGTLTQRENKKTLLDFTFPDWLKIQRSFLDPARGTLPAQIGWTRPQSGGSFYNIDAAVQFQPKFLRDLIDMKGTAFSSEYGLSWSVIPTFEAHVSNNDEAEQNSLSYQLNSRFFFGALNPNEHFIKSHYFLLTPMLETDRKSDLKTFRANLLYSPTITSIALGRRTPLFNGPFSVLWRPYVGFELGTVIDEAEPKRMNEMGSMDPMMDSSQQMSMGPDNEFARFLARWNAQLWTLDSFQVSATYEMRQDLNDEQRFRKYWNIDGVLYLDEEERVSVGISYKKGRTTPTFQKVDVVNAWIGFKF